MLNKLIDSDNDTGDEDCSDEENERILHKINRDKDHKPKPPSLEDLMKLKKFHIEFQKLQRLQQYQ